MLVIVRYHVYTILCHGSHTQYNHILVYTLLRTAWVVSHIDLISVSQSATEYPIIASGANCIIGAIAQLKTSFGPRTTKKDSTVDCSSLGTQVPKKKSQITH